MAGDSTQVTEASGTACFVCDDQLLQAGISLSCGLTTCSGTELPTKISQVMGAGFIVVCSTDDKICTRCSELLNEFDKLEMDLATVHTALTGYLNKKYNLLHVPGAETEIEQDLTSELVKAESLTDTTMAADACTTLQEDAEAEGSAEDLHTYKCKSCTFRTTFFQAMAAHQRKCKRLSVHCTMCESRFENQKQFRAHIIADHLTTWPCHFCGLTFTDQAEFTSHVTAHLSETHGLDNTQALMENELVEVVDVLSGNVDGTNGLEDTTVAENAQYIQVNPDIEVNEDMGVILSIEETQGLETETANQWDGSADKDKLALIWEGLGEAEEEEDTMHHCLTCSLTFFDEAVFRRHLRTHGRNPRPPSQRPRAPRDSLGSEDDEDDLEKLIERMRARDTVLPAADVWPGGEDEQIELARDEGERVLEVSIDMEHLVRVKKLSSVNAPDDSATAPEMGGGLGDGSALRRALSQPKPAATASSKAVGGLSCGSCPAVLPNARTLRTHRLTHAAGGAFACDACDQVFVRERQLADHVARAHRDPHCRFCGKEILKAKTLRSHEQRHQRDDRRSFDCTGCERSFKTATGLRHHAAVHTGEYKYCCDFCGRGFMSRMMMEEHRVRHTKEERYVCDICGKKFSFQSTYWIHRKWHDTPMPYKCPFCGRLFKHSSLLAVHRRKHTGERPYKCPHCPLSFPVGGTLKRHLILHTGIYPFMCQACKRGFTTKHKYVQHLQKAHQVVVEAKPAKSDFRVAIRDTNGDAAAATAADTLLDWEMADDSTFMLMDADGEMGEIILEDALIPCHAVVSADGSSGGQMVQIVLDEAPMQAAAEETVSLISDLWPTYSVG